MLVPGPFRAPSPSSNLAPRCVRSFRRFFWCFSWMRARLTAASEESLVALKTRRFWMVKVGESRWKFWWDDWDVIFHDMPIDGHCFLSLFSLIFPIYFHCFFHIWMELWMNSHWLVWPPRFPQELTKSRATCSRKLARLPPGSGSPRYGEVGHPEIFTFTWELSNLRYSPLVSQYWPCLVHHLDGLGENVEKICKCANNSLPFGSNCSLRSSSASLRCSAAANQNGDRGKPKIQRSPWKKKKQPIFENVERFWSLERCDTHKNGDWQLSLMSANQEKPLDG